MLRSYDRISPALRYTYNRDVRTIFGSSLDKIGERGMKKSDLSREAIDGSGLNRAHSVKPTIYVRKHIASETGQVSIYSPDWRS